MRRLREIPCRVLARKVVLHVRSGKNPMRFAGFWRICVRFSDPPYAPSWDENANWSKRIRWLNIPQLKLGNIQLIFPNFQFYTVLSEKIMSVDKYPSIFSCQMEAIIVYLGQKLLLELQDDSVIGEQTELV